MAHRLSHDLDARLVTARDAIHSATGALMRRAALQQAGRQLDERTGGSWLAEAAARAQRDQASQLLVLDSVRSHAQADAALAHLGRAVLVHLRAETFERARRFRGRVDDADDGVDFEQIATDALEGEADAVASRAHLVIDTTHLDLEGVFAVVSAFLEEWN